MEEPKSFDRERKERNKGRRVAIAAAVIPIPGSTVLQIATSVVEYRKSFWASWWMYGIRITVAADALRSCQQVLWQCGEGAAYTAPSARISATDTLVRGFLFK